MVIDFRDLRDMNKVLCTYKVGPRSQAFLFSLSPSTLLCMLLPSQGSEMWTFTWLDCKGPKPEIMEMKQAEKIECRNVDHVSFVNVAGKQLLICFWYRTAIAYNIETGNKEWTIKETEDTIIKKVGSADAHGLLYVCVTLKKPGTSKKGGIQMFSALDGKCLGYLIKDEEKGLGVPLDVQWHEQSSSLIITHDMYGHHRINLIQY